MELIEEVCPNCGKPVTQIFRYTDWNNEENDQYGTLEECEKLFQEACRKQPDLRCSIYDVSECSDECGFRHDEGIEFNANAPEYQF